MKRKIFSIILTIALCTNIGLFAFAAEPGFIGPSDPVIIPEITIRGGITVTNVYDRMQGADVYMFIYTDLSGTLKFDRDMEVVAVTDGSSETKFVPAGEILYLADAEIRIGDDCYMAVSSPPGSYSSDSFPEVWLITGWAVNDDTASSAPPAEEPSSWAAEEVKAATAAGLVPENLQKNYTKDVSRGDVAQMFINLLQEASGQTIDDFMAAKGVSINNDAFTDTADRAVLAANALGIINGVGEDRFDPGGTLTRAQIAAVINRAARVMGIDSDGYAHSFTDVQGHWVDAELGWPVQANIIRGVSDNSFNPDGNLTAEQAIAITYRAVAPLSEQR
ncbi:MAG: S-layer homology domain-containing protein [Oscillospiraceae bacterium]|nr:S-layer homology domain-containing protein [Oscillospiraceae bacterium]